MKTLSLWISHLRCDLRENPLGIDKPNPELSWILNSEMQGQRQSAYRIIVSSSETLARKCQGDLWDSGKIKSDETVYIPYQGKKLESGMVCHWRVRVWDKDDQPVSWSRPAFWTMGILDESEWQARWIGRKRDLDNYKTFFRGKELFLPPSPYLRKKMILDKKPSRATLFVTALGLYEVRINGSQVGQDYFTPGWTDYHKRLYYQTYDVTPLLHDGENALAAILADGWYAGYVGFALDQNLPKPRNHYGDTPLLFCQLEIEFKDGTSIRIATDPSWKTSYGPIREADLFMGETYDAQQEMDGWDQPGFNDEHWQSADLFHPVIKRLQSYPSLPVQLFREIRPDSIYELEPGTYIFDMGQNFAGFARIHCSGQKGQTITLRYGEMLHPDGRLMTENLRYARATDTLILRDEKPMTWQPRFTYHGFQYIEVIGLTKNPDANTLTGLALTSSLAQAGTFECSDKRINKLYSNILWTQRANFIEIPTDCPQRDERCGWSGDAQIYARSAAYNTDVLAFMKKWLVDLKDAQQPDGAFTDWAPYSFVFKNEQASGWMDAGIIVPYTLYRMYGDTGLITKHYKAMKRFLDYLESKSKNGLLLANANDWGDWLAMGKQTSLDYIASAFYAHDVKLFAEMAGAVGKDDDASHYKDLFLNIQSAFSSKYVTETGRITEDTQTAYALALYFGLIPDGLEQSAAANLVRLIENNQERLATGFLGVKHLLPVLTTYGYIELACKLFTSTEFPSWGYSVVNGATTIWERWDSFTLERGFHPDGMNSFCHYAFGSVCEWMFSAAAGIEPVDPGFKTILLRPHFSAQLSSVNASYLSIRGMIKCKWHIENSRVSLWVKIPANTRAHLDLGLKKDAIDDLLYHSGYQRIEFLQPENVLFLESGNYEFTFHLAH
ncbi:Bacterial alpha-L-rhamnosidase [candidate division KSB1 bacterium]|nr:Bacterial alpha-L-rhamnosidase [candidate division KSB1 bacterium]